MTVRVPITADAAGVTTQLDRIRDALRRAGQEGRDFAKLDLSHPELKDFATDLKRIQDQVERLHRDARGATASTARSIHHTLTRDGKYDGSGASLFGKGGLFDQAQWQQARPNDGQRHFVNAGRYILQGTRFAPQSPAPPPIPIQTPQTPADMLSNAGSGAISGAASLMRGFLPAMLAMAGLSAVGGMVSQGVQQATGEAISTDRLLRTLRDLDTDFDKLRNTVADTTNGLGLTYEEAQKLAATWTTLANSTNAEEMRNGVRMSAGIARGYGMDPNAVAGGMARAAYMGEDPRRFAGILADAISGSGLTGRPQEVMESLLRFQEQNAKRMGPANGTELFANAYSTLSATGNHGLRGAAGEALLGRVDQAVMAGGAAGDAGQFLTWRALSRHGNTSVFRQQYALEGGMFGGVNGGEAGANNPTNYEALSGEIDRMYPGAGQEQADRRHAAMGRYFGISMHQSEALETVRRSGGFQNIGHLAAGLAGANMQVSDLKPENIRDAAEIARPGADLGRWRTTISGRLGANDPGRARLAGVEGEDLRRELLRTLMQVGRGENAGTTVQQSMADFSNALTHTGRGLLPILSNMRDAITSLTNVAGALSENIGDGYLAMFGSPEQRTAARERLAARMGGGEGGAVQSHVPGGVQGAPAGADDATTSARARYIYDQAIAQGYTPQQASAWVAGYQGESATFNPAEAHDGSRQGVGIAGWNNGSNPDAAGRITNMGYYAAQARGLPRPATVAEANALGRTLTFEEQVAFGFREAETRDGGNAAAALRQTQSPGEGAGRLVHQFFRPSDRLGQARHRGMGAEQWYRRFNPPGGDGAAAPGAGAPASLPPPPPPPPTITPGEAELMGLTGVGPHTTPTPGGIQADPPPPVPGVRGTPVPITERPLTAPIGQQSSMSFQPLRVVVENGRGDTVSDQFLGLQPPSSNGPPRPWGVG